MAKERVTSAAGLAFARSTPETTIDRKNCRSVEPNPAEAARMAGRADLISGANLTSVSVRCVEAVLQARLRGAPMMAQCATLAGGGGRTSVPSRKCATNGL